MSLFGNLFGTKKTVDMLAIGDTVTDAFIRLKDASVHCSVDHTKCELCMRFGEKIPYEFATVLSGVGNSANAAVSASRLGLNAALMAYVGDDMYGAEILRYLFKQGVDISPMTTEKGKATNYHYVLWYESERTILVKHTAFSYKMKKLDVKPRWIYLSSLGDHTEAYHDEIADYLDKNKDVMLAFQPGTFQIKLGADRLKRLYARSEVFVCNVEEARVILGDTTSDIKGLMVKMRERGPKIVLITDGPKGAYVYDGVRAMFQPPYPDPKPPYERTGAGDAFASTFVSALVLDKSVEKALLWAPINSMSVVQYVGAQEGLLKRKDLEDLLRKAPSDYTPKVL